MKRLALLAVMMILLLAGGGLTHMLLGGGLDSFFIVQSTSPDSSVLTAAPWQTEQLLLMVGFLVVNLLGMGVTLGIVFWLLHRGVRRASATANAGDN